MYDPKEIKHAYDRTMDKVCTVYVHKDFFLAFIFLGTQED